MSSLELKYMLVPSRFIIVSDPVVDDGNVRRLVISMRSTRSFSIPEHHWRSVEVGRPDLLPEDLRDLLRDAFVLVPSDEDELHTILHRNREASASTEKLLRCIQPTAACQLNCEYCGQVHSATLLSNEAQDALIQTLDNQLSSGRYSILEIGWFGGEPLLGMSVIRRMTPLLRDVAVKHGCIYDSGMTTNGFGLSSEVAKELFSKLGVESFQITLDGPQEVHDTRRRTKDGGTTFEQILCNMSEIAKDESFRGELIVRCNVDRRNASRIPELIETLADKGLQRSLIVYFAAIQDWNNNEADALALPPEEFARREIEWMALLAERGFKPGLIPPPKPIVCMAVTPEWRMTDPEGHIYNCIETSLASSEITNLYSLGTDGNERSLLDTSGARALNDFNGHIEAERYPCATCTILPVCGGMCPKKWNEGHEPCPPWRYNMKERLELAFALLPKTLLAESTLIDT